jgi:uncharacterized membrane protein
VNFYESHFETGWDDVDRDEATRRAYAIGVAEKLGEHNRRELELLYRAVDTNYGRSLVELAYKEGRQEASIVAEDEVDEADVWEDLIEGEKTEIEVPDHHENRRESLPEAMGLSKLLDRIDADSTDAMDRPDFLEK